MSIPLSQRIRPGSEAAPWVVEEVKRMEKHIAILQAQVECVVAPPRRRPPCALMTASAAIFMDCKALHRIVALGFDVVVVRDEDFGPSLRVVEQVRKETAAAWKPAADEPPQPKCTEAQHKARWKDGWGVCGRCGESLMVLGRNPSAPAPQREKGGAA